MKKPLRILVLMHPSLVPPDTLKGQPPEEVHRWKTRYQSGGRQALADRSRRPKPSPWQVSAKVDRPR